jgi:uncharacterized YigZ family protein
MESNHFYLTIAKESFAEYKEKGSKFLAFAYPVDNKMVFKQYFELIKSEHSKASHHCFAYRLGLDTNNYRLSDDGEPSGTAGKPILNQILSKQITNVAIIVVRYFGGTLLGVSGLINAYKTAAALTLQIVPIVQKTIDTNFLLEFDYTIMNNVMLLIRQFNCSILEQHIQLFCVLKISVANAKVPEFLYRLKDFKAIQIQQMN